MAGESHHFHELFHLRRLFFWQRARVLENLTLVLLAVLILSTLLAVVEIGRERMVLAQDPLANRLSSPLGEDVEHNGQDQDNALDDLLPK